MHKFFPCCLCAVCLLVPPVFWGGCGDSKTNDVSQVHELTDDIFQGDYRAVDESALSAYAEPFSLERLFANQTGLIVREQGLRFDAYIDRKEIVGTMKMVKAQTASSPAYEVLYTVEQTAPKEKSAKLYSLYDDTQHAYIQETSDTPKFAMPSKELAFYASFSKLGYFSIHKVAEDMRFDIFSAIAASKESETVRQNSDETIEITEDEIYLDTSDSDYVKIKIAFAYEQEEADEEESFTASMQILFIYDSRTHEPVAYHFSFYTTDTERGSASSIGIHFSIAPYEGSITPPDDLDGYIKAE